VPYDTGEDNALHKPPSLSRLIDPTGGPPGYLTLASTAGSQTADDGEPAAPRVCEPRRGLCPRSVTANVGLLSAPLVGAEPAVEPDRLDRAHGLV
jgi:hypothetical protein